MPDAFVPAPRPRAGGHPAGEAPAAPAARPLCPADPRLAERWGRVHGTAEVPGMIVTSLEQTPEGA